MKVKIIKCSCDYSESSTDRYWYHDKVGEVFEVGLNDKDEYYRVIKSHGLTSWAIIPEDCIDIVDLREDKLNELGI
jgi:hypothetical protein